MSELEALRTAVDEVRGDVKQLLADQAGTSAKLDMLGKQNEAQIEVLFERRDRDNERVRKIELDYVPRGEFTDRRKEHDGLHERIDATVVVLDKRLNGVEAKIIKLSLLAGAIVAIVQAIGFAVIQKVIG